MEDNYSLRLMAASGLLARRVREAVKHLRPLAVTSGESGSMRQGWCGSDSILFVQLRYPGLDMYIHSGPFSTPKEGLEMLPAFEQRAIDLFRAILREDT